MGWLQYLGEQFRAIKQDRELRVKVAKVFDRFATRYRWIRYDSEKLDSRRQGLILTIQLLNIGV